MSMVGPFKRIGYCMMCSVHGDRKKSVVLAPQYEERIVHGTWGYVGFRYVPLCKAHANMWWSDVHPVVPEDARLPIIEIPARLLGT